MNYKPFVSLTNQEADRVRAALIDCLHGEDPTAFIPRLAVGVDGSIGLTIRRPRLYDPSHSTLSPSGQPWIAGDAAGPTEVNWLASEVVFHPLTEALELLRGPPEKNPEIECEKRQRQANDLADVARRREESRSQEHNERLAANQLLQARRQALGEEIWTRELPSYGKVLFRIEAACRKVGQTELAAEIRKIALEALQMTSASPGARLEITDPRKMYLDGPEMPMEKWLP